MAKLYQSQKAYQAIREKLVSRALEPGERLKESLWAQKLDVNRSDVRQALARLLGEGLLSTRPKGGYFVREFTDSDMKQFNEVRLIIETAAANLAVERATAEDIKELDDICDHMALMVENGYSLGVTEADLKFHQKLIEACQNPRLEIVYKNANLPLTMSNYSQVPDIEELRADAREHKQMVEALKNKDKEKLVSLLSKSLV